MNKILVSPLLLPLLLMSLSSVCANTAAAATPHYKPSSRSPEAMDITSNAYGFSRSAPEALELGRSAPDFSLPRAGGGTSSLAPARSQGPVVIVFYRGHW